MGLATWHLLKAATPNCPHLLVVRDPAASILARSWLAGLLILLGEMAISAFYMRPIWATQ